MVHEVDNFDIFEAVGQGRVEIDKEIAELPHARWVPQKEHFPVPSGSLIALPTGHPKEMPQIQHKFGKPSKDDKQKNAERREAIRKALAHSWKGYRDYAWGHDEISPVSQDYKNPFNGWAATLVDSLDTLWILGFKEEFDEAIIKVKEIDFHTSVRKDIPIFETTIRYLGGLLGAYDISEGKYPVLLEKARELADVLIYAADTPNRMPVLFYYWAPSYASQPHRASSKAVLAELGSLSLEFSRLAILTNEPKYYDMIARITNELEKFQTNTSIPGLWPQHIDASGCKKSESLQFAHSASNGPQNVIPPPRPNGFGHDVASTEPGTREAKKQFAGSGTLVARQIGDAGPAKVDSVKTDAADKIPTNETSHHHAQPPEPPKLDPDEVDCEPQGLASPVDAYLEYFTVGGMADSTYEYLPKMHMLLGGREPQYEKMYRAARKPIIDRLLYRPMTPKNSDILFPAVTKIFKSNTSDVEQVHTATHLSCFLGGMFALGSRLFHDLESDIEIAKKLTEGCIWAYSATASGVMPEEFYLTPCPDKECLWNETAWHAALDPDRETRQKNAEEWWAYEKMMAETRKAEAEAEAEANQNSTETSPEPMPELPNTPDDDPASQNSHQNTPQSQQHDHADSPAPNPHSHHTRRSVRAPSPTTSQPQPEAAPELPPALLPHPDYITHRITTESLAPGMTRILSHHYILRPEALESVFILYRITGNPYYRDAGWRMFNAIQNATQTEHGHSAISDVMSERSGYLDSMESFWIAETLKYAFLLFADEGVVRLGEWVL